MSPILSFNPYFPLCCSFGAGYSFQSIFFVFLSVSSTCLFLQSCFAFFLSVFILKENFSYYCPSYPLSECDLSSACFNLIILCNLPYYALYCSLYVYFFESFHIVIFLRVGTMSFEYFWHSHQGFVSAYLKIVCQIWGGYL